jgi:hypothetical protein
MGPGPGLYFKPNDNLAQDRGYTMAKATDKSAAEQSKLGPGTYSTEKSKLEDLI